MRCSARRWNFYPTFMSDVATISSTGSWDLQCLPYEVFDIDSLLDVSTASLSIWVSLTDDSVGGWVGEDLTIQSVTIGYTVER
jgi:hypothetical protein